MFSLKKGLCIVLTLLMLLSVFTIAVSAVDGAVPGKTYIIGDVDLNEKVNINDVSEILKSIVKLTELNELKNILANVNGDSVVNIKDVSAILMFIVKLEGTPNNIEKTTSFEEKATEPLPDTPPRSLTLPYLQGEGIYAHGFYNGEDTNEDAWAKWEVFEGNYYLFLPVSAHSDYVEIYNNYNSNIVINGITVPSKMAAFVPYANKNQYNVTGAVNTKVTFMRSSTAEGALYMNTLDENKQYDPSLIDYINDVKGNEAPAKFVIADNNGSFQNGDIKKIKGRGNTTWSKPKKPYNINFNDTINFSGLSSKKFSLLANYQDSAFIRNRLLYDMANELDLPYSPPSRFIDVYINGRYNGTYQFTNKVEMGTNYLVTLKDDASDKKTENFNFLIELGNNADDEIVVTTSRRNHGQLKNPEPDDTTAEGQAQLAFIKTKWQELENALFTRNLDKLAEIADVDSFAKMYIINEFCKNVDGGNYSTFFAYNAAEDMFTAAPVWDFDCGIGNLYDRAATVPIELPTDFYTKRKNANTSSKQGGQNFLAVFVNTPGAEQRVAEIWSEYMPDVMEVLAGKTDSKNGVLKSIEEYRVLLSSSIEMNYMMWPYPSKDNREYSGPDDKRVNDIFDWVPTQTKLSFINSNLTTSTRTYTRDFDGALDFAYDWSISRYNWLTNYYNSTYFSENLQPTNLYTSNYYITGSQALTGSNFVPDDTANIMTYNEENGTYVKTYFIENIQKNTGENYLYRFRVTDGTFDNTWGYSHIGATGFSNGVSCNTSSVNNTVNINFSNEYPNDSATVKIIFSPGGYNELAIIVD